MDKFDVESWCAWDSRSKRATPLAALQELRTKQYAINGQKDREGMADYGRWCDARLVLELERAKRGLEFHVEE